MQQWRVAAWVIVLLALAGCLSVETRVQLFQDGSGTYRDTIEVQKKLLDLALGQSGLSSYEDMVASALDKVDADVARIDGVRVLDIQGAWEGEDALKITVVYWFDSVDAWNRLAEIAEKPALRFTHEQVVAKGKPTGASNWTLTLATTGSPVPGAGEMPPAGQPGMDVGSFRMLLAGPVPARELPEPPTENSRVRLVGNGEIEVSGSVNDLANNPVFTGSFTGQPLDEAALAAAKAVAQIKPSPQHAKMMELVAQFREQQDIQDAAARAITASYFTVHLVIDLDDRVLIESSRTYHGETAALFAGREAMLHALAPEVAGNYRVSITPTPADADEPGLVVTHTRREPLPLAALTDCLEKREDAGDIVYTLHLRQLLPHVPEGRGEPKPLGKVVVGTPYFVTGSNGVKTGASQVELTLLPADLSQTTALIVRTNPNR